MFRRLHDAVRRNRDAYQSGARLVYPWELPSIMRKHIYTGAMGMVYFHLLSGIFLVTFGGSIGLTHWHWAALSGISSFVLGLQLLSAYVVRRLAMRKRLWFVAAVGERVCRAVALAAAFYLFRYAPGPARFALLGLLVLANAIGAIAAPPWMSWLADLIPSEEHGHFIGRRSAWISLTNVLVIVPLGLLIDRVPEATRPATLMGVFGVGFAVGLVDLLIHRTIPEPPMEAPPPRRLWHEMVAPLRDAHFRPWLLFNAAWTFSMTLGGALAAVYFVESLGIRRNLFGGSIVLIVLPMLANVVMARRLGRLVDRHGVKRMLLVGHLFWATLPAFWIFATPETALIWLGGASLLGGLASSTAMTAASKLITRLPPAGHVPMYVAVSTCVGSLAGGLGPLVGGMVLHVFRDLACPWGPVTVVAFHLLFAASVALRASSTLLIRRIGETDETAPLAPDACAAD